MTRFQAFFEVGGEGNQSVKDYWEVSDLRIVRMRMSQTEIEKSEGRADLRRKMGDFHV